MGLVEVGWGDVDWIGVAQGWDRWRALMNSVLNLRVPKNAGKLSSVQKTRDLSSSAQLHGVSYYPFKALQRKFFKHFFKYFILPGFISIHFKI
jgi:hypothetical protein